MNCEYTYYAEVINIVDGDTVDLKVDLGFGITITERFRLYGIDTPEIRTRNLAEKKKGVNAKSFLSAHIYNKRLRIETHKGKKGKFGRYLATIFVNNVNINFLMVTSGNAIHKKY